MQPCSAGGVEKEGGEIEREREREREREGEREKEQAARTVADGQLRFGRLHLLFLSPKCYNH